jgi:hypothetical protein
VNIVVVSISASRQCAAASSAKVGDESRNQAENGIDKDALAASRRGARKEGGMPVPNDRASFKNYRRCGLDLNENNRGHHSHKGHYGVDRYAERAVVGFVIDRMHVGYLDHDKKRQQDQAQYSRHLKSIWL